MLSLRFFPKPKEMERRESVDRRGESALAVPDMLTGGYFLFGRSGFSTFSDGRSVMLDLPKTELARPRRLPSVFDRRWLLGALDAGAPSAWNPATLANFAGTLLDPGASSASSSSWASRGDVMLKLVPELGWDMRPWALVSATAGAAGWLYEEPPRPPSPTEPERPDRAEFTEL